MRTQMLGEIELDRDALSAELQRAAGFRYCEPYGEFVCGRPWKTCMLWTPGGEAGDNVIAHYDLRTESRPTNYGRQTPLLLEQMEQAFSLNKLAFARLAVMSDSVLVPHRDYLEFGHDPTVYRPAHRFHVPLASNQHCFHSENDTVYRMNVGEVWSIDVAQLHSAGVLADEARVHLILDFIDDAHGMPLRRPVAETTRGIPAFNVCRRAPLSKCEHDELLQLASVVNHENLKEVFGIVIKTHYRKDGGKDFVWRTMNQMARRSRCEDLGPRIRDMQRHLALERAK